jgi:Spy/CpxP family protein refolding chaperone
MKKTFLILAALTIAITAPSIASAAESTEGMKPAMHKPMHHMRMSHRKHCPFFYSGACHSHPRLGNM